MKPSRNEKGIVVIFALVLMGAVAMVATAFAVLVRSESKAARNSCLGAQAELSALSGLENAVRAIKAANQTYSLVSCPNGAVAPATGSFISESGNILSGWHRYFEEDDQNEGIVLSDAQKWVWHYKDEQYAPGHTAGLIEHEMRGRVFAGGNTRIGAPATQTSFTSEYAVCVVDLDGKLHALPSQWGLDGVDQAGLEAIIAAWAKQPAPFPTLKDEAIPLLVGAAEDDCCRSVREIASRAVTDRSVLDLWRQRTYAVETYMTPYPIGVGRSRLNVNTARKATIEATLCQIPSVDAAGHAEVVAGYIASRRPYASRPEFEDALSLATQGENGEGGFVALNWDGDNDEFLTEEEFNDILNSTSNSSDDSDYDEPANPGVYSYDGWEDYEDGIGPSQSGSTKRSSDEDTTWGCEFKFTSRYFHIYCVGQVKEPGTDRILARKKLHAVYDAEAGVDGKVLWFRWNVTDRGNIGDFVE